MPETTEGTDKLVTQKGKTYLVTGLAVVAVLLLIAAVVVYFTTGDTTVTGGVGVAASAAAAEALRRRQEARKVIEDAKVDTAATTTEIKDNQAVAKADMAAVPTEVAGMTDEDKVKAGNDLLG